MDKFLNWKLSLYHGWAFIMFGTVALHRVELGVMHVVLMVVYAHAIYVGKCHVPINV